MCCTIFKVSKCVVQYLRLDMCCTTFKVSKCVVQHLRLVNVLYNIYIGENAWTYDVTSVLLRVICIRFIEPCTSL